MIKTFIYLIFFTNLLFFFGFPVFSAETTGTGECPSGFHGNKKSFHPKKNSSLKDTSGISLEERINYVFKDQDLKRLALIHRGERSSYRFVSKPSEFLGDAVFNLIIIDILIRVLHHMETSKLVKEWQFFMSNNTQADLTIAFKIDKGIYLSGHSIKKESSRKRRVANYLEALVGLVYLDGGYAEARKLVALLIKEAIEKRYPSIEGNYWNLMETNSYSYISSSEQTIYPPSLLNLFRHLGGSLFKLHVIDIHLNQFPEYGPKQLIQARDELEKSIRPDHLDSLDQDVRLNIFKGWNYREVRNPKKVFHSLLGIVYLEEGYKAAKTLALRLIEEVTKENNITEEMNHLNIEPGTPIENNATETPKQKPKNSRETTKWKDHKSILNNFAQKQFQTVPEYQLVEERERVFIMEVWINDQMLGKGRGRNKKKASQEAAASALRVLGLLNYEDIYLLD